MKKIINKLNNWSKNLLNKLNNYRLTSVIISGVSLLTGIISLGLLFIYYFAGDVNAKGRRQPSFVSLGSSGRIMGMIFFLFCLFVLILSIVVIYLSLPNVLNKEKVSPKKAPLVIAVVNGGLEVVVLIFSILAIVLETPNTLALYIVTIPFTLLTCVANILCIVPFLKGSFYQPAVGTKLFLKKQKEAE